MGKAIIIYNSRTGTTKRFGERIHEYLLSRKIISQILSIDEIGEFDLLEHDFVFLGCWTNGFLNNICNNYIKKGLK